MIKNSDGLLETKDQKLNIMLLTLGFEVKKRIVGEQDGKMYLCYEDTPEVQDAADRWQKNLPFPIKDARAFFLGDEIYKTNLHAHLDEMKAKKWRG